MRRYFLSYLFSFALVASVCSAQPAADSTSAQTWEERFRALPDPANLRAYAERLAAHPHHVGSVYNRENAEWIRERFEQWGLEARIETYEVIFPTPRQRLLELQSPRYYRARLEEPAVSADPSTSQRSEQLPPYNAYSIDGDVTAHLVYANYGRPEDYEVLERFGVSVRGAIVIVRYGGAWRGVKPKLAAEHGAIGCIIYSDPRDDGYSAGDVYPLGPYRPRDGVQRGSVLDIPVRPGDPFPPGAGTTGTTHRLPLNQAQAQTLTRIPVLPISWGDAQPLLDVLGGPTAPEGWRGGLPITYHLGPGPARVRLAVAFDWKRTPLYNVIARIPGSEFPDEWVLRGNHHDAWVNGAADPVSGLVSLLEEARAMGELHRRGWNPRRTILFCVWDGEEAGLLGSTQWAEEHAAELRAKAVAYINSDSNGRGYLDAGGSHSLERLVDSIARQVEDPESRVSVWQRLRASNVVRQQGGIDTATYRFHLDALGSGSDYSPFLDHLGIASLNLGFAGEDGTGIYHSIYDTTYWYSRFSDSQRVYGRALAQVAGTAVMRLADDAVLPFDFEALGETIHRYLDEVQGAARAIRAQVEFRNRALAEGLYAAVTDPRSPAQLPVFETPPPELDFAPLSAAVAELEQAAAAYSHSREADGGTPRDVRAVNRSLIAVERALSSDEGLPGRPWYRHLVYAPGLYTGYGVKTLPGVRESIEQLQWDEAKRQIARTAQALRAAAATIRAAAQQGREGGSQ